MTNVDSNGKGLLVAAIGWIADQAPPVREFDEIGLPRLGPSSSRRSTTPRPLLVGAASAVVVVVAVAGAVVVRGRVGDAPVEVVPSEVVTETPPVAAAVVGPGPFSEVSSLSWSEIEVSSDAGWVENIVYFQDRFLAFTSSGRLFSSGSGIDWSEIESRIPPLFDPFMFASESMVVLGGRAAGAYQVWGSGDGVTWTLVDLPEPEFDDDGVEPSWLIGMAEYDGTVMMGINYSHNLGRPADVGPYTSRFFVLDDEDWKRAAQPFASESAYALNLSAIPTGFVAVAVEDSLDLVSGETDWRTSLSTDGSKWDELDVAVQAVNNGPVDETIASTPNGLLMVTQYLWDSDSALATEFGDVAVWASPDGIDWAPTLIANVEFWPRMVFGGELGAIVVIADRQDPNNAMTLFSEDLASWSIENLAPTTTDGISGPTSGAVGRTSALLSFSPTTTQTTDTATTLWIGRP